MYCGTIIVLVLVFPVPVLAENNTHKQNIMAELSKIQFNMKPDSTILYNVRTDEQDDIDSRIWGGVNLKKAASHIGDRLRELANDELGVTTLQGVFDASTYVDEDLGLQAKVTKMGQQLHDKLTSYIQVLKTNRDVIQNLYRFHLRSSISSTASCCSLNTSAFSEQGDTSEGSENRLQTSLHSVCDLIPSNFNKQMFNPGRNLTSVFSKNIQKYPALKWQYFVSSEGVQNEFPSHLMRPRSGLPCSVVSGYRHRDVVVRTLSSVPKNLVVLIDVSYSLTSSQLKTAQQITKQLIYSLSSSDKVTVLTLSRFVESPFTKCSLRYATHRTKSALSSYTDELSTSRVQANHSLGLQAAFSLIPSGEEGILVYISKGLLHSVEEPYEVFTAIAEGNRAHAGRVIIHTYGMFNEGGGGMYEETFLRDIASQNFSKFEVEYTGAAVTPGVYHSVYSEEDVAVTLNNLFVDKSSHGLFNQSGEAVYSTPYNDIMDRGLVVSLSLPCLAEDTLMSKVIGVVGIDVSLEDLTDKVVSSNKQGLYAFLIDVKGHVITHPGITQIIREKDVFVDRNVSSLENLPGFSFVLQSILSSSQGVAELPLANVTSDEDKGGDAGAPFSQTYVYSWYRLPTSPYIVVMRALKSLDPSHIISESAITNSESMVYHRLDLGQLPSEHTCLYFKQLASFSTSALFLSAKAFEQPYEHMRKAETKKMVSNYLAYITDSSSYISKPGLKEEVRNEVIAVSNIDRVWLQQWKTSAYKSYIVRRYVATPSGSLRMYPATLTHKLYDPTSTPWYTQAMRLPGRIILTRPYVDMAGAGYVVSMAHSVYEGRSASLHTPQDPVAAVMGADFPASYFERLVWEAIPMCEAEDLRCFVFDSRGYIITHPYLQLSGYQKSEEEQHLTHMEPLIANDILGHKSLVVKKMCNSFSDSTIQRYYQFNTALSRTLTNLKSGEQCVRYQLASIPGSNTFIVMVNETCELRMSAFCPCSITDRLCLNCQRMEQAECECPCECPLTSDPCTGDVDLTELSHDNCDTPADSGHLFKLPHTISDMLGQCVQPVCSRHSTRLSCLGLVGCSWCHTNADGVTPLSSGYCDVQQMCFGGVLGARTPYNDQLKVASVEETPDLLLKNIPVGPVTGAVLCIVLLVVLGVYCYRHSVHRRSPPEGDSPDTSSNQEVDGYVYHELSSLAGPSHAHLNLMELNRPLVAAAHISPYQLNEHYVPPRPVVTATESSDHGYSTMTAQEEAETASATSCKESVRSRGSISKAAIKFFPPLSKNTRSHSNRGKHDNSEYRKLLPAELAAGNMSGVLPQTIEEQLETDTAMVT